MKPYYYVCKVGGQAPTKKHQTIELAKIEAERLAQQHPGKVFEILQCLGFCHVIKASTFWFNGFSPETETAPKPEIKTDQAKLAECISLVDAVYDMVQLYKPKSPSQIKWRENWLRKAREAGASPIP